MATINLGCRRQGRIEEKEEQKRRRNSKKEEGVEKQREENEAEGQCEGDEEDDDDDDDVDDDDSDGDDQREEEGNGDDEVDEVDDDNDDIFQLSQAHGHCFYLGTVRNKPQSTAAITTCNGITYALIWLFLYAAIVRSLKSDDIRSSQNKL